MSFYPSYETIDEKSFLFYSFCTEVQGDMQMGH